MRSASVADRGRRECGGSEGTVGALATTTSTAARRARRSRTGRRSIAGLVPEKAGQCGIRQVKLGILHEPGGERGLERAQEDDLVGDLQETLVALDGVRRSQGAGRDPGGEPGRRRAEGVRPDRRGTGRPELDRRPRAGDPTSVVLRVWRAPVSTVMVRLASRVWRISSTRRGWSRMLHTPSVSPQDFKDNLQ